MGKREVLNKYYPPDFDPFRIPRMRRGSTTCGRRELVLLPMRIRCGACANYMYKGAKLISAAKKLLARKTHLFSNCPFCYKFYFKSTKCSAELAMKTDPQNSDYVVESDASRNFEPWRLRMRKLISRNKKREAEEMVDATRSLVNRTLDSKREMDTVAALDVVKSMKSRQATVSIDAMLEALQPTYTEKEKRSEEEDEALVRSIFQTLKQMQKEIVRRILMEVLMAMVNTLVCQVIIWYNGLAMRLKAADERPSKLIDSSTITSNSSSNRGQKVGRGG